ncbi:MAG: prepilin peptidase [Yoonia sp.]|jgi:prepilin peptidase CpaA
MTAFAAYWFLPAVIPLALFISWNDMRDMKITNKTVAVTLAVYAVLGPFAFGWEMYLWQWLHFPIALVVCMALWSLRVMGGGDAKLIAAMAPFFVMSDLEVILRIFAASLLGALVVHTVFRLTPLKRPVSEWKSWNAGRYFPKGFPLSMTLVLYLVLAAVYL